MSIRMHRPMLNLRDPTAFVHLWTNDSGPSYMYGLGQQSKMHKICILRYNDPAKTIVCSPQIFLTKNWIATSKQLYGERSVLYIHESQQDAIDPRKSPMTPFMMYQLSSFVCMEETEPDLIKKVEDILVKSSEQWVVILGLQTERLRALHRILVEKN